MNFFLLNLSTLNLKSKTLKTKRVNFAVFVVKSLLFLFVNVVSIAYAQKGKDGALLIPNGSTQIVNIYTTLTNDAAAATSTIIVGSVASFSVGDLIMIIQMQGAVMNTSLNDATWGAVTALNNCGNNELLEIASISGSTITFVTPLTKSYTALGKTQVVRIPRYTSLTINAGGKLSADGWDGTKGGVIAVEVQGVSIINGIIDATGKGFRGGALDNQSAFGTSGVFTQSGGTGADNGAEKGEGIGGFQAEYDALLPVGGRFCRAAAANGGGGGNNHNAGGGGGANAGNIAMWNGKGNPDNSNPNYAQAWNLESANFANNVSSGGGRGGYTFSGNSNPPSPYTTAPGNAGAWGGHGRYNFGGLGGRPLDYSTGNLFFGGGGGAGDQNNGFAGPGGRGGGIIQLLLFDCTSGAGQILANGEDGFTAAGIDAGGGAGGGGAIIINTLSIITGVSVNANGGTGGSQLFSSGNSPFDFAEAEGPGGGGGGGYVEITNGTMIPAVSGGSNGITNRWFLNDHTGDPAAAGHPFYEFNMNGATKGGAGIANVKLFALIPDTVKACKGQALTLNAKYIGTPFPGTVINWYNAPVAGVLVAGGTLTYTTPVLEKDTTFYLESINPNSCFRVPVVVKMSSSDTATFTMADYCEGSPSSGPVGGVGFKSGGTYSFNPAVTDGATIDGATGSITGGVGGTTYTVEYITSSGCPASATDNVTVNAKEIANFTISPYCAGDNSPAPVLGVGFTSGGSYKFKPVPTDGATLNVSTGIITGGVAGATYTVLYTTPGTCKDSATANAMANTKETASFTIASYCAGGDSPAPVGAAGFTPGGAYKFKPAPADGATLNASTGIITGGVSGATYTIQYNTPSTGACRDSATTNVVVKVKEIATFTINSFCEGNNSPAPDGGVGFTQGGSYKFQPAPADSATLNTSTGIITGGISGTTYTVQYTTPGSGCKDSATANAIVNTKESASFTIASYCSGSDSPTPVGGPGFTPGGIYKFKPVPADGATLNTSTGIITGGIAGSTYTVLYTTPGTCKDSAIANVIVNAKETAAFSISSYCAGGDSPAPVGGAGFTSGGSYKFKPVPLDGAVLNTSTGIISGGISGTTYTVLYTTPGSSCKDSATANAIVNAKETASFTIPSYCAGSDSPVPIEGVGFTSGGIYKFKPAPADGATLNTSTGIITGGIAGTTYTVFYKTTGACKDSSTVNVTVNASPDLSVINPPVVCLPNTIDITNSFTDNSSLPGNVTYYTDSSATSILSNSSAIAISGTYYIKKTSLNSCFDIQPVSVSINSVPSLKVINVTTVCPQTTVDLASTFTDLNATTGTLTYWADSLITIPVSSSIVDKSGVYYIMKSATIGNCSSKAPVIVKVESCETVIPNVISPNNDGKNEYFVILGNVPNSKLEIYNRWGTRVFIEGNYNNNWNGDGLSDSIYYYIYSKNNDKEYAGWVEVIR